MATNPSYYDSKGQSISLVKQIGQGGEGTVWTTNRKGYLAKIYHKISQDQVKKLEVMIANPPKNPTAGQKHIAISWPTDLIKDHQKRCVGFLMPQITGAKEMIYVYHPKYRITDAPRFNWYCLHIIALNFIYIIKEIHAKNYIIGDINTKNILVNDRSLVSLIDTDSFQVKDSKTGNVYRCSVGAEGFTPPELISKDLSQLTQTRYSDQFRLGVMIHYLLFGYHPFMGKWSGSGDPPGQNESISKGYWPYGNNSLLKPSQNTIPIHVVHPELEKCFLKCFNDGHQSPSSRPSPEDWLNALQLAITDLVVCSKNKNHIYSKHSSNCYWCDRANTLKVDIFPSVQNPIHPKPLTSQSPPPPPPKPQNSSSSQNRLIPKLQSENRSLTVKVDQLNKRSKVLSKLAAISTIIATALAGLSLFQYNELEKYTYVNFCNKTSYQTIYVALAYWDGTGLRSKGWYSVKSGECNTASVAQNYNGNVYVYAEYNSGEISWPGQYSFCVDPVERFSISESDKVSCSGSNQKSVKMSAWSVSPGTNNWNLSP